MNILVTGAAGYIGSVITAELVKEGHSVVALDNLSQGHRKAVAPEAVFILAELGKPEELEDVFRHYQIEAVIHLAAESLVEQSMTDPGRYFQNNVISGINLLDIMLKHNVRKLVFSSSAAIYGQPRNIPIEETDPTTPINPYGESKLMFEKILHWYGHAYELEFISLRYFNAAGATERLGEHHNPETHLIPNVLKVASGQQKHIPIFGMDYPTKDGSCVRDYIHVLDIAHAHILALQKLQSPVPGPQSLTPEGCRLGTGVYNLGSGEGYSVMEVVETARKVTGAKIPAEVHPRRQGDPAVLIASSKLAKSELGWQPEHSALETIIESAWRWQKSHPYGYKE